MSRDPVPVVKDLSDIYTSDALEVEQHRWNSLIESFGSSFDARPEWVARAPGRVNVIGDHVDYCGLGCLPAAIQRDVLLAGRARRSEGSTSRIRLRSTKPEKYKDESIEIDSSGRVPLDKSHHSWANYVRAALTGVLDEHKEALKPFELDLLCDGNVPAGGGLSSSAAMVIASSLACLQAMERLGEVDRTAMTEIAIASERLVGVNSGGMDQTASVFGERSSLLHIQFVPRLTSRPVVMPSTLAFVIANSLVTSEKQTTAKRHYNLRVVEMRAVAVLLARHLEITNLPDLPTFKEVVDAMPEPKEGDDEATRLRSLLQIVEDLLGSERDVTPWPAVLHRLDLSSQQDFESRIQQGVEIEAPDGLKLYKRARHVITESLRVLDACRLLDNHADAADLPKRLGDLMNESQDSLRDFCESSAPECDELITLARQAGSLGSRVTGAGWGGCTVHLVPAGRETALVDELKRTYYSKRYPAMKGADLEAACFATRPERGASIYVVPTK